MVSEEKVEGRKAGVEDMSGFWKGFVCAFLIILINLFMMGIPIILSVRFSPWYLLSAFITIPIGFGLMELLIDYDVWGGR
jgi:hypothetical protein